MTAHICLPTRRRRPAGRSRAAATWATIVAVALAVTVLAVPQSVSARTATHKTTATERRIERSVFSMLNAERRAHHLKPLTRSHDLRMSARSHNATMSRFNTMSHQLPREAFFATRISKAGYHWSWAGENIGWNSVISTRGVRALEATMYHERPPSDGHRQNILSRHFRNVGVDVYIDRVHHKVWLTTDFGRR